MKLPKAVQNLLCHVGQHAFTKPRKSNGSLVRTCTSCKKRQAAPPQGGVWLDSPRPKRARRKKESGFPQYSVRQIPVEHPEEGL